MTDDALKLLHEIADREAKRLGMDVRIELHFHAEPWDRYPKLSMRCWWPDERQTNQIMTTVIRDKDRQRSVAIVEDMVAQMQDWYADRPWEHVSA